MHEVRMSPCYDGRSLSLPRRCNDFYIELLRNAFLQLDVNLSLFNEASALFQRVGRQVAQHFELIAAPADEGAQCNRDGKAGHPGSGNPDAHRIFQDIGAQQRLYLLGLAAQLLGGTGRAEGHGHGFGTADGRYDFFMDQRDDPRTGLSIGHSFAVLVILIAKVTKNPPILSYLCWNK